MNRFHQWLSSVRSGNMIVQGYTKVNLPSPGTAGRLARVIDEERGLWMDDGTNWEQLSAHTLNVLNFPTLDAAIADIGSATRTLLIPVPLTVTSDLTVPINITLWF